MIADSTEGKETAAPGSSSTKPRARILYFDLLTIFACFAVVVLHCNGTVHSFKPTMTWNQALGAEVLFFWAVPVFFMLTGANNMGYRKKYSTKTFLLRRAKRLLVPFLFWSLAVYLYHGVVFPKDGQVLSAWGFITAFMDNTIVPIYWFFFAIISLTLAMPVLSCLAEHKRVLWYIVTVQFVLSSTFPFLSQLLGFPWSTSFNLPVANEWVMFALLGYLLANTEIPRKWRFVAYMLGIEAFALRYIYTYIESYAAGEVVRTLFSYGVFTGVLPAVAVFLLFKYSPWDKTPLQRHGRQVAAVSACAFGIYLIHILLLQDVLVGYLGFKMTSAFVRFVGPFLIFFASLAIVAILRRIPIVKEVIP